MAIQSHVNKGHVIDAGQNKERAPVAHDVVLQVLAVLVAAKAKRR
jgi:hypothetical protein